MRSGQVRTQKELGAKAGDTIVEDFPRTVGNSMSVRHNPGSTLYIVTQPFIILPAMLGLSPSRHDMRSHCHLYLRVWQLDSQ